MVKADAITNENEKKAAQEKASQAKLKAENDMEVAVRVLALAKSLEDNANEIDVINRSVNPDSYSSDPKIASSNTRKNTNASGAITESGTTVNLDEPAEPESGNESTKKSKRKSKETKEEKESKEPESAEADKGLVYKIQLGAFSKEPSKRDFKAVGKVKIAEENGMYKVLYGNFSSKEEAFKKRDEVVSKGFADGFVVSYQDGVRVK